MRAMIGVYDSGFGGLTVLRRLRERLPGRDFLYLGDSGRAPYGGRDAHTILDFAEQCVERLFDEGCRLVVVACNTVSCTGLRHLQRRYAGPGSSRRILGITIPAAEAAVAASKGHVGVIATARTVSSGTFVTEIQKLAPGLRVRQQAAPLLAPLVEEGWESSEIARLAVERYLEPLRGVDTIVLGCTHYPLLAPLLAPLLPEGVRLVDPARAAARRLGPLLLQPPAECELASPSTAGRNGATAGSGGSDGESVTYCVTGPAEAFACAAHAWLGERPAVRSVNLQSPARVL